PGGANEAPGAGRATPPSAVEGARSQEQEQRRPPVRRPGEETNPARGGSEKTPPQRDREQGSEPLKFGTPAPRAPMGAAEQGGPRGGPAGLHQPVAPQSGAAGQADEARVQRERRQGASGQQPQQQQQERRPPQQQQQQQQRGGAPASADHGQGRGQPQGGHQRQPKQTPPPGQQ